MKKFFTYRNIILLNSLLILMCLFSALLNPIIPGSTFALNKSAAANSSAVHSSSASAGSSSAAAVPSPSAAVPSPSAAGSSSAAAVPSPSASDSVIANGPSEKQTGIPSETVTSVPIPSDSMNSSDSLASSDNAVNQIPSKYSEAVDVKSTRISLGESSGNIIRKLGVPNRIVRTEYDFKYYVYNNDYRRLLFVAVKGSRVVGYYTDSIDFNYKGISSGSGISTVNRVLGKSFTVKSVLTDHNSHSTVKILMDKAGTGKVTGIYVLSDKIKKTGFTLSVMKNIELLVYDLTNSIRARNNLPILSWSSSAALSARKHSIDMAVNKYFSHYNQFGSDPRERLMDEGIYFKTCGENIIAGYGSAIISCNGWFNSKEHRKIILNKNFKNLGTGFYYKPKSTYKTYITQDFYG